MDDQRTDPSESEGMSVNDIGKRDFVARFRLKWLLLAFIPAAVLLTLNYRSAAQQRRLRAANDLINNRGFNAHFESNCDYSLIAKNGNLTDSDLATLLPLCDGENNPDKHKIIRLELCGSKVSDEAISQFGQRATDCELVR
jgi:hypothetical protein